MINEARQTPRPLTAPLKQPKITEQGIAMIHHFESCRLTAYQDVKGIWTIGWGNTQYENGISVKRGDKITQQRADQLFSTILSRFTSGVLAMLRTTLNDNQFSALVSFAYNCGIGALSRSTLLKKVNANPLDVTIRDEFMKWNKAGNVVVKGLTRRRKAEADMYFS